MSTVFLTIAKVFMTELSHGEKVCLLNYRYTVITSRDEILMKIAFLKFLIVNHNYGQSFKVGTRQIFLSR